MSSAAEKSQQAGPVMATREGGKGEATKAQQRPVKRSASTRNGLVGRLEEYSWRLYMWLDGTMPLSMLETYEKVLLLLVVLFISSLFWWSVLFHLPKHVQYMLNKGSYYLFGTTANSSKVLSSTLKSSLHTAVKQASGQSPGLVGSQAGAAGSAMRTEL